MEINYYCPVVITVMIIMCGTAGEWSSYVWEWG